MKMFGFPCSYGLYPNTTKQKSPLVYPLSTSVNGLDGKFDLFHQGPGFAEAGLWSIGISQKPRWCHTICIQVWCEVERAEDPTPACGRLHRHHFALHSKFIDLLELETHPSSEQEGIL